MSGEVYRIVKFLEERKSAFAVSRLIMLTGLRIRKYHATSPDDPDVLRRIDAALPQLLSPEEIAELTRVRAQR